MPKITVSLGLTVQLGEDSREFARPFVEIRDIDTDKPLAPQLQEAKEKALVVMDVVSELIAEQLAPYGVPSVLPETLQELNRVVGEELDRK